MGAHAASVIQRLSYKDGLAMTENAMCEWDDLAAYLKEVNQSVLLQYIDGSDGRYKVSDLFYSRQIERQPSVRMQVAASLAVLGAFEDAEKVHNLRWENLSPAYDKITNGILRRFMLPWPAV
jgi:hypothetical protein